MIGREVILTNRSFTPEELFAFMEEHWDKEQYNDFRLGTPTDLGGDHYVMLPATPRHLVIVYSRAEGGLFSKADKVVLSVAMTKSGMSESLLRSVPTGGNIIAGAWKTASVMSQEKERKGPAQEVLLAYTAHMKELLGEAGYLKQ